MQDSGVELKDIVKQISELIPFYTPEWEFVNDENDPGAALVNIFALMYEGACKRFRQVPYKNLVAFMEMIGIQLLPPQQARAPVTFSLSMGAVGAVLIPVGTQVAANPPDGGAPVIFETERNILATPAKLCKVFTTVPALDGIFEHTPVLQGDNRARLFAGKENQNLQEHSMYLAHSEILNLKGRASVDISFYAMGTDLTKENLIRDISWEWWNKDCDRWVSSHEDREDQLKVAAVIRKDGEARQWVNVTLDKDFDSGFTKTKVFEMESFWLRCRIVEPMTKESVFNKLQIDHIMVHSGPLYTLPDPDGLFCNDIPLSIPVLEKPPVYPFGKRPRTFDTFYIANNDALSKKGAEINLQINLFPDDPEFLPVRLVQGIGPEFEERLINNKENNKPFPIDTVSKLLNKSVEELARILSDPQHPVSLKRAQNIKEAAEKEFYDKNTDYKKLAELIKAAPSDELMLSWEYWNGTGWQAVKSLEDGTENFTQPGSVSFKCPSDLVPTTVNGQENFWIRVRIINGDYGKEKYIKVNANPETWQVNSGDIRPPKLCSLKIGYAYAAAELPKVEKCIAYNNLQFSVCKLGLFKPFDVLPDGRPALYLGFDRPPLKGPVSMFLNLEEQEYKAEEIPRFTWEYYREADGRTDTVRLEALDGTNNLTYSGNVEFVGPPDFTRLFLFGAELSWIRAVDADAKFDRVPDAGTPEQTLWLKDIRLNTVWASQAETVRDEIIGSGDGESGQKFRLRRTPVISEAIWVNEFSVLSEEERAALLRNGRVETREVRDEKGTVQEFWVRWESVEDLAESAGDERHYMIDRAFGQASFGNGINGAALPVSLNNIKAEYRTGGGARGNVGAGEISGMRTSVAFVDKVVNHVAAAGGTDTELVEQALTRGPQMLKHGNRAVTVEDYEWLARQASRSVARVKCFPNCNDRWEKQTGWVTVIIVPEGGEAKPRPDLQLKRRVEKFLRERAAGVVTSRGQLLIREPEYKEISVIATLVTTEFEMAPLVEKTSMERLKAFLHPLSGGSDRKGWEFGRHPYLSDFYGLLESIEGVDFVTELTVDDSDIEDYVLIYSGNHNVTVRPPGGQQPR
ncbi:putative baseplate assembly protein [Desulfosporosinus sp. OT]|uniref:putative baseplate assembly protein n=1 Tax=Desulfosporosinus sp. OT TaxID=913865 RepID=UPI0002239C0C|nr:putative baseplate assembly protein [Desulfosporosinus sp. OT]EGW36025.1 hypothetical protein DOT_6082 [Desulfosporosinus sp. OT]